MFVTEKMIGEMATHYGSPSTPTFDIPTPPDEIAFIRSTQKAGRNHDVTIYAIKDEKVVVISKHFYPPDLYRAPSGGLDPGESFEDGIAREMSEEIGCVIELDRFLLRTSVNFVDPDNSTNCVRWRSLVFLARVVSGDFKFTDTHEIKEVRLADWSEFELFSRIMLASDRAGLHYRAQLHEAALGTL